MVLVNPSDPRARRTRNYIQNAFTELLAETDFEDLSIQHIMERAELNRATFYNHFQDKYELLDVLLNGAFKEILAKWIPSNPRLEGSDLLRNLMMAVCEWQLETTKRLNSRRTLSQVMEDSAKRQLYNIILSCLTDTTAPPSKERRRVEWIATMISWSIYGAVVKWSGSREEPVEEFVEDVLPILMSNLRTLDIPGMEG